MTPNMTLAIRSFDTLLWFSREETFCSTRYLQHAEIPITSCSRRPTNGTGHFRPVLTVGRFPADNIFPNHSLDRRLVSSPLQPV